MKKFKKIVALTMASTMALVPMNVLADDVTDESTATGTIDGDGEIEGWIDDDQFCVTLPTIATIEFAIDPQGLSGLSSGDTLSDSEVAGTVIFGEDTAVTVTNKSSFAVGFDVELSLSSKDENLTVTAKDAVDTGTDRNIYIAAQPIVSDVQATDYDIPLVADTDTTDDVVGSKKFAYALKDAADAYQVTVNESGGDKTYSYTLDSSYDSFDTVSFGLTGLVNKNADWSDYAKDSDPLTMSLDVSYTIKTLGCAYDDAKAAKADETNAPGLLTAETAPAVAAKPSAPTAANFTNGKGKSGVYSTVISNVSLGKAELAAESISTVKLGTTAISKLTAVPTSATAKGYMYDADAETLTLYGPIFATTAADGTTGNLVITFADNTICTIVLTNVVAEE